MVSGERHVWQVTYSSAGEQGQSALLLLHSSLQKLLRHTHQPAGLTVNAISVKLTKDVFLVPTLTTCGGFMTNFRFSPATMSGFFSRMMLKTLLSNCKRRDSHPHSGVNHAAAMHRNHSMSNWFHVCFLLDLPSLLGQQESCLHGIQQKWLTHFHEDALQDSEEVFIVSHVAIRFSRLKPEIQKRQKASGNSLNAAFRSRGRTRRSSGGGAIASLYSLFQSIPACPRPSNTSHAVPTSTYPKGGHMDTFLGHFEYNIMLNIIAITESIVNDMYSLSRMRQLKLPESLAQKGKPCAPQLSDVSQPQVCSHSSSEKLLRALLSQTTKAKESSLCSEVPLGLGLEILEFPGIFLM
ncbi:hypothetical protein DV515_00014768 [Chloebia gouldiae]|uniref:Uncharacterized protein n=1 Tax=Chloebia gouldiae TaxID=44316 RepID=A0A3L8RYD7_CHLGU|nr:hypothetical protein DV515_00014768 [Chloebia gouldiae]